MSVFEELFTVAKEENVGKEILQELKEIKQLMVPKVIYVPVYVEQKPWWHCEPYNVYPDVCEINCEPLSWNYPVSYGIDFGADHVCLHTVSVST